MMFAAILWGAGWPALKLLANSAPSEDVMFVELTAASLFAATIAAARRMTFPDWRRIRIAASVGLIEPGIAYLFFALGIARTTASFATMIDALQPIAIIFIAAIVFRERLPITALPFVFIAICGTALSLGFHDFLSLHRRQLLSGDALVALGVLAAALHSVLMKRVIVDLNPVFVTAIQHIVGAIVVGAAALVLTWHTGDIPSWNVKDLAIITGVGIITIAVPFWLYIAAVRTISGTLVGIGIAFIPISGLVLSAVLVKEALSPIQLAGAAIAIVSLFIAVVLERNYRYVPR